MPILKEISLLISWGFLFFQSDASFHFKFGSNSLRLLIMLSSHSILYTWCNLLANQIGSIHSGANKQWAPMTAPVTSSMISVVESCLLNMKGVSSGVRVSSSEIALDIRLDQRITKSAAFFVPFFSVARRAARARTATHCETGGTTR